MGALNLCWSDFVRNELRLGGLDDLGTVGRIGQGDSFFRVENEQQLLF